MEEVDVEKGKKERIRNEKKIITNREFDEINMC